MKRCSEPEPVKRITVGFPESEYRALVVKAAELQKVEGRLVTASEVVRDSVRARLHEGKAA